ncbi:MAG TPA: nucleotidyltransferase domain-containing protein [Pyrinomonadaceae bacterium]|nr:nucleotidyltransferase domain-containing protein [Pyrinomonadaceae bacterium]
MNDTLTTSVEQLVTILKNSGAKDVYLFGSVAKGIMRSDSDIDLAVSGLPPENFFKALSTVSNLLDRPIHLIDLDEVTPFTRYLIEEGELQRVG